MGTSKSSGGSPSGAPMVPPWTPDPGIPTAGGGGEKEQGGEKGAAPETPVAPTQSPPQEIPIAPPGRFGSARTSLGRFAASGAAKDMRRGLGHYTRTGLGGAATAARRMGGTAQTAGSLFNSLAGLASGTTTPGAALDPSILQGRSANAITTAIVEAVRPVDGTQDAEASRDAIQDALSELLNQYPDADLINLDEEQRWTVVEGYLATDIYNRIQLDVGKTIQDKSSSLTVALQRLAEVKSYVRETVAAKLRTLRSKGTQPTPRRVGEIIRVTIRETFDVFEGYA
jgi:hypothetical protein